jgi:hypothetical protein
MKMRRRHAALRRARRSHLPLVKFVLQPIGDQQKVGLRNPAMTLALLQKQERKSHDRDVARSSRNGGQ